MGSQRRKVSSLLLTNWSLHKRCPETVARDTSAKGSFLPSYLSLQQGVKEQPHRTWHEMGFYRKASPTVLQQQELSVKFLRIMSMRNRFIRKKSCIVIQHFISHLNLSEKAA